MKAWIARDKDGTLCAYKYSGKPRKWRDWWVNGISLFGIKESDLPPNINPQWEDEEPIEVEIKIERIWKKNIKNC